MLQGHREIHSIVTEADMEGDVRTQFTEGVTFELHCLLPIDVQLLHKVTEGDSGRGHAWAKLVF